MLKKIYLILVALLSIAGMASSLYSVSPFFDKRFLTLNRSEFDIIGSGSEFFNSKGASVTLIKVNKGAVAIAVVGDLGEGKITLLKTNKLAGWSILGGAGHPAYEVCQSILKVKILRFSIGILVFIFGFIYFRICYLSWFVGDFSMKQQVFKEFK